MANVKLDIAETILALDRDAALGTTKDESKPGTI